MLVDLLERNDRIVTLGMYGNDIGLQLEMISYWQRLNEAGRRLVKVPNLSRNEFFDLLVKYKSETDVTFFFLRARPDMMNV